MKPTTPNRIRTISTLAAVAAAALLGLAPSARAVNYSGNGDTGFGGDIGTGIMNLSDDGTNISGRLTVGHGNNMYNTLVIYVDTGASGGFADTSTLNDQNDALRIGISGVSGSGRSTLTFTNGFRPTLAIALGPNTGNFGGIWQLAAGGNNSLNYVTSASLSPVGTSSGPFTFSIPATALGLTNGQQATIKIFGTYISNTGYRSTEAIAGNIVGPFGQGWYPFTQTGYATYKFAAPPTPTNYVTFSVDMTARVNTGDFVPGVDTVYCGGSFQLPNAFAFTDFPLVQQGSSYIYTNTYPVTDTTNTLETYKFSYYSVAGATNSYDNDPNRSFTVTGNGQVVPLVYYNNFPATPSATTNTIRFSIDMGPQIYLGHFNPQNGDTVQVFGTFEQPNWLGNFPPNYRLTNNPTAANTNIYYGEYADGNYPGTVTQYKYVIVSGDLTTTNYEGGANRNLVTPTTLGTLPLAYFSGVSNIYATPVSFSVDMTVPLSLGTFNPGNGDYCGVAGTFQTNSFGVGANGLALTNTTGNIYAGQYIDHNAPGTAEQYKFVINPNGGSTIYESPASTGGGNRHFFIGSTSTTNPLVYWNDQSPNDVLLTPTTVTLVVDMGSTNTADKFGNTFNPDNDLVLVDGDIFTPNWRVLSHFDDPTILGDYCTGHIMNRVGSSFIYTLDVSVPAGNSVHATYKYGILHDSGNLNTNVDNEAGFGLNHSRYIRTTASQAAYTFPTDIFGQQSTNLPAATEPQFGDLTIGQMSAGNFPINWLGLRGVHLQYRTNLLQGAWFDATNTDGTSATNWPTTGGQRFFRLVKP